MSDEVQVPAAVARYSSTLEIIQRRKNAGLKMPLEVILEAMDTYLSSNQLTAAVGMAIQAAPYVHPKLKDVVLTGGGDGDNPVRLQISSNSMKELTEKELDALENILTKVVKAET